MANESLWSNDTGDDVFKIGMVHADGMTPWIRARQLFTTGLPTPFTVKLAKRVRNPRMVERQLHRELNDTRINPKREFFTASFPTIRSLFDRTPGKYCKNTTVPRKKVARK